MTTDYEAQKVLALVRRMEVGRQQMIRLATDTMQDARGDLAAVAAAVVDALLDAGVEPLALDEPMDETGPRLQHPAEPGERSCEHGYSHPEGVHGCCGCCAGGALG